MRQSELISELERRGYEITERRLTDWRSKGLLPKLKQLGQGRGSGTFHMIEDPETTINQAIAVFECMRSAGVLTPPCSAFGA
jgi:hypothetical protein